MAMSLTFLNLSLGFAALYFGADWLVRGAARLAASFQISPLVIGMTVVAFGTSLPEVVTCIVAAARGSTDLALGNVIGSNIANIGLILGVSALVSPIAVSALRMRRELPFMIGATLIVVALAWRQPYGRLEGLLLVVALIAFTVLSLRGVSEEKAETEEFRTFEGERRLSRASRLGRDLVLIIVGLGALLAGADRLVNAAVEVARLFGISEFIIAVSMVAVGTSLPELATSMVASARQENDVLVGNLVGSNVFNLLGALGLSALVRPIPVRLADLGFEFLSLLLFTVAMVWVLRADRQISRTEGGLLFGAYVAYVALLFQG